MTMSAIINALGERVQDTEDSHFLVGHKIQALDNAQKIIVSLTDDFYLSSLKTKRTVTVSGGEVSLDVLYSTNTETGVTTDAPTDGTLSVFTTTSPYSFVDGDIVTCSGFVQANELNGLTGVVKYVGLGTTSEFKIKSVLTPTAETTGGTVSLTNGGMAIRNGIFKVYDETNGVSCSLQRESNFDENSSYAYGSTYSLSSDTLKISPTTCVSATVHYIKEPTGFVDNSTECDLIDTLEPILLDLAESELWNADNRLQQGANAYKKGFEQIQILNGRFSLNE